jgi:putative ABC transport system ATP-binding protein
VSDAALELHGVRRTFSAGTTNEVKALQGVDLILERGEFAIVLGTNGSGKSSLLNAIAGSFQIDRGVIRLDGQDLTHLPEHRRARMIGRVFQDPFTGTASDLTIAENLALAARRGRLASLRPALTSERLNQIRGHVAALDMGLEDRLEAPMGSLSGGQRQALTLLMATMVRPSLLMLDEHTAALDPKSEELVLLRTQELIRREGLTALMVTHSLQQAVRMGDRVLMMHRGQIVQDVKGVRKRRLRVEELLDRFEENRNADLMDAAAAAMVLRNYV